MCPAHRNGNPVITSHKRGFKVSLVNAHYLKSVPGRKSDVSDCQWIQYLHLVGLLTRFSSMWILSHSTWYKFGRSGHLHRVC